jgi:hypothetical protein
MQNRSMLLAMLGMTAIPTASAEVQPSVCKDGLPCPVVGDMLVQNRMAAAKKHVASLDQPRMPRGVEAVDVCTDTDGAEKFDAFDGSCINYGKVPAECGKHDDDDFTASELCCACGGGKHEDVTASILQESVAASVSTKGKLGTEIKLRARKANEGVCTCEACSDIPSECEGWLCPYLEYYKGYFTSPKTVAINGVPLKCQDNCDADPSDCNGMCDAMTCPNACGMCSTSQATPAPTPAPTPAATPAPTPAATASTPAATPSPEECEDNPDYKYYGTYECAIFAHYPHYCQGEVLTNCLQSCGSCYSYTAGEDCLLMSDSFTCSGYQCVSQTDAAYTTDMQGNSWCLSSDHALCQQQDSGYCNGECLCPTMCQHACGRCPE